MNAEKIKEEKEITTEQKVVLDHNSKHYKGIKENYKNKNLMNMQ